MSSSQPSSSTSSNPSSSSSSRAVHLTYNWTVPSDSISNCLYDENDMYYEYDDYQDDVKLESPSFGAAATTATEPDIYSFHQQQQHRFVLKLYPRSTEGCADCGSLVLQIKSSPDEKLRIDSFKASVTGYSGQVEMITEGWCYRSTALLSQSLGWKNSFFWKELIRNSSNLNIYCEVTYQDTLSADDRRRSISSSLASSTGPFARSPTYHQQRLSEDFTTLRVRSQFSDVTLVTADGREFAAHRAILSARSSVFDAMFSHEQLAENQDKRVRIMDVDGMVMEPFLSYIYSGDTSQVDALAPELLAAADKYDIQSLIKLCIQSMMNSITAETAAKLFHTADLYQLDDLKRQARDFINQHPREVMQTEGWTEFVLCRADLILELYTDLTEKTCGRVTRFH